MIKPCISCRLLFEDTDLKDVRGDTDVEGYLIIECPETLQINENDAIEVCFNCEKVLRDRNINDRLRNVHDLSNIRESEDIQLASQSLDSRIEASLSSSIENQAAPPSFDLEILKQPGEVEKLAKDPKVKVELRKLITKPMPAAAKKRKLSEMLENTPNIASSQSSSNSESEIVIERSPTQPLPRRQITDIDRGNELLRYYLSQSGRLNRPYVPSSQSQEVSPSQSLDASNHDLSVSSQEIIKNPLIDIPRDPVIFARPQRQQNDGNDHSNLAAPRRIHLDQPTETSREIDPKETIGG